MQSMAFLLIFEQFLRICISDRFVWGFI